MASEGTARHTRVIQGIQRFQNRKDIVGNGFSVPPTNPRPVELATSLNTQLSTLDFPKAVLLPHEPNRGRFLPCRAPRPGVS